ncbi:MAG: amidohydrolase [Balneolaceae bacterium]|nr:MAG: amidohydrolase [Balneolaceae bacterium]
MKQTRVLFFTMMDTTRNVQNIKADIFGTIHMIYIFFRFLFSLSFEMERVFLTSHSILTCRQLFLIFNPKPKHTIMPLNDANFHQMRNAYNKMVLLLLVFVVVPLLLSAQTTPVDGMKDNTPSVHAFINAAIVTAPGQRLENATLVIRDGVVESIGTNIQPPADARLWNMDGKTIYPGFIDAHSDVGMKNPRTELDRGSLSWNPNLRAHLKAADEFDTEDDGTEELRKTGFTAALSVPPLGIFAGEAVVMSLADGTVRDRVVRQGVAQSVNLTQSGEFGSIYPTSPIGVIALIRQTLYDTEWHRNAHRIYHDNPAGHQRPENNVVLAALEDVVTDNQPILFRTSGEEEILRVLRIAEEFPIKPWILGNGHEYKILDVLREHRVPLILPLSFPETPNITTPEDALNQDLAALRHWYLAPENPARLASAGIEFSFTAHGLENSDDFLKNIREAVAAGLARSAALAAITTNPAELLGIGRTHGSLERGKVANIVVTDGALFDDDTRILDVWIDGYRYVIDREDEVDVKGEWLLAAADGSVEAVLHVKETGPGSLGGRITIDGREIELSTASLHQESRRFRTDFPGDTLDITGTIRLTASVAGSRLFGWAEIPGRERIQWAGNLTSPHPEQDESEPRVRPARDLDLAEIRPAMEFGRSSIPEQPAHVLVRNATIWTMGPEGILENADLLITNGNVALTGYNLSAPSNAVVIDAQGKHVTPGLIDAHIHSGTDGVNEMGNAIVPEVRLGDVLNINNIWMYRQIAGGLTTAHVKHGSANPIGGQNAFVKMRWGSLSNELLLEGAPRTVKFALGENPKRVGTGRYPETRMGVEQIIADRFRMARDYEARWREWEANRQGIPPRRDLRLDAIVDILNGEIEVQSHSYRQDEILALMRVAEEFDFRIKAFHHAVEAYKVAPELTEHGAGAVVWTDWSSFKIEAYDATVYNARLLHEAGVLTSLHSDDSQLASRMNWEAAKMVRAGMDPVDALALVTINTAKVLGIDHMVGSLEPGKNGDFVIWSGDPLSTFTKAEQTWIEGRRYFDLEEDALLRRQIENERSKLIERILEVQND